MVGCKNHRLQQWLQFFGLPPPPCPSSLAVGFIDMETEEKFESASYESSDGELGSDSEGGESKSESEGRESWSDSEGGESPSESEGGDSPSESEGGRNRNRRCRTGEKVPLTAYEASRLVNIARNNKKLEDLGLPALLCEVSGAVKADATRVGVVNLVSIPKPQCGSSVRIEVVVCK